MRQPPANDAESRVYGALSPASKEVFLDLPPAQRQCLVDLFNGLFAAKDMTGGDIAIARRAMNDLNDMLGAHRLATLGTDRRAVLDHLGDLLRTPLVTPPGANASEFRLQVMATVMTQIAHPLTIRQGTHGTCAATVSQIELAMRRPADYVGFVAGLLSTTPAAGRMPNGETVPRLNESLSPTEGDVRPAVSRIVQASLMNWHTPATYSNKQDQGFVAVPFVGQKSVGGGMYDFQQEAVISALRDTPTRMLAEDGFFVDWAGIHGEGVNGFHHEYIVQGCEAELARQRELGMSPPLVPVGMSWGPSGHAVDVVAMSKDRVTIINPQGQSYADYEPFPGTYPQGDENQGGVTRHYVTIPARDGRPELRLYADGTQSMDRHDFDQRLHAVYVDEGIYAHYRRNENQSWENLPF